MPPRTWPTVVVSTVLWAGAMGADTPSQIAVPAPGGHDGMTFDAVIAGEVIPPPGSPRAGLAVEVVRLDDADSFPIWRVFEATTTDADGRFRASGLPDGEYYVRAYPGGAASARYNRVYYPAVTDPREAVPLHLDAGDEVHVRLETPLVPRVSLSGRIEGIPAIRDVELTLRQLDEDRGCLTTEVAVPVAADGTFTVPDVQVGRYGFLAAAPRSRLGARHPGAGLLEVEVGTMPMAPLPITWRPLATIRGRFVISGNGEANVSGMAIRPSAWGRDWPLRSRLTEPLHEWGDREDGTFAITGLVGAYSLDVFIPDDDWIVEAIVLEDGTNIVDLPYRFEEGRTYSNVRVIVSNASATVTGLLPQELRQLGPGGTLVAVFPEDESLRVSRRLEQFASPHEDGRFSAPAVVPGLVYLVAACPWPCTAPDVQKLPAQAVRLYVDRPGTYELTLPPRR